jgi:hypothetical protein
MPIPFLTKKPAAHAGPTLEQLQKKRSDAVAARDSHARELDQLRQHRIELATAGDDVQAVQAAGARMATLTDSIELAGSVIANLDAAIAPLERELAERARIERIEAAKLTYAAAYDRAQAAARGVQKALEHITEELEQRCGIFDAANLALQQAAQVFTNAGGEAPVHQVLNQAVRPFDAGMAPFMEQLLREIRQIPKRLAAARESAEGVRRGEEHLRESAAAREADARAAYLSSGRAAVDAARDAENTERNRVAEQSAWGRRSA